MKHLITVFLYLYSVFALEIGDVQFPVAFLLRRSTNKKTSPCVLNISITVKFNETFKLTKPKNNR